MSEHCAECSAVEDGEECIHGCAEATICDCCNHCVDCCDDFECDCCGEVKYEHKD